jgi:hypothetical protein
MRAVTFRLAAALAALGCFLSMSWLYGWGNPGLYEDILRWYGVMPFRFPFVDISGSLAAWECVRQGIDVIMSDPCDVLHGGYSYSPLWMAASSVPLGVDDTMAVGWCLDLLFIGSLTLLPPPRRPFELVLVLAGTLSTMVVFALERANPDLLLFVLALAAGLLADRRMPLRVIAYCLALLAALCKYYPIMVLITVFRERPSRFVATAIAITAALAVFCVVYHTEIGKGLPTIPQGPYNTDLFAAKNLPFLLGEAAGSATEPSSWASLAERAYAGAIYVTLVGGCLTISRRLLSSGALSATLASLGALERTLLVIGSAVIAGCFFAGQSIGYRGVFLLMVIPGLLAISRVPERNLQKLGVGTSSVVVLLMWGECLRFTLDRVLKNSAMPQIVADNLKILFWFIREFGWWWTVSVMLAVLADFLWDSPIVAAASHLADHLIVRARRPDRGPRTPQ